MIYFIFAISIAIAFFNIAPHWSLLLGVVLSFTLPILPSVQKSSKMLSTRLLQISIVLMGANLNIHNVLKNGIEGILITFVSISMVFIVGLILARSFKVASPLSELICAGTSICGGSAISALSPVLNASGAVMATSLGIVFILNAVSVFLFPPIGHLLSLSQEQFGTWAALAIHDTSSVVAASQIYGETALKIGTTLKLTRALWIIPLTFTFSIIKKSDSKITVPWFIFLFLLVSVIFSFYDGLNFLVPHTSKLSKIGLSLTLFLIGLSLNKEQLRSLGLKPIIYGLILWILTAIGSLIFVMRTTII